MDYLTTTEVAEKWKISGRRVSILCKEGMIKGATLKGHGGGEKEPELLASCYYNSLKVAADSGIRFIAFPSISTGGYGYPMEKAAREAVAAVKRFLDDNPDAFDLVEWVLFDDRTLAAYEDEVDKMYA